jgi:hypothetical protein
VEFIEAPVFTVFVSKYLSDDAFRELQIHLANDPELGDVMPGTGGFRKLRWADARRGKGRRGGLRVIYFYFPSEQQVWLMTLYDKDEAADLTRKQKAALKAAIDQEAEARRRKRMATKRQPKQPQDASTTLRTRRTT